MKMNEKMISESVEQVVSSVKFICENELTYLELDRKLNALNEKMDTLQTLVVYSDDSNFTNSICAMQLVTNNLNTEFHKDLGTTFSNDFKERQLDFLRNVSTAFDINLKDVNNIPSLDETKSKIKKEYKKKVNATKKEYKKETVNETVNDIIQSTNEKLNSYFVTANDMKEYLKYMSKFYNYSIGNCCLIEEQFSGAIAVGSFKFWKDNGFSVNKGEKGIQILVPAPLKKFIDEKGQERFYNTASKKEKELLKKGVLKENGTIMTYKKGYVFDVSQTNATSDDLPKLFPNKWLEGDVKDYTILYKALESVASNMGVSIIEPKQELGVAKGVSYTLTKEVALNPRNGELQNIKTLIHELAHSKLHTATTHLNYTQNEKEFQAEMVAVTVASYFNIDTDDYSLSYLDHYTKNTNIKEKKKLLNEIKETSKEFIEIMEDYLSSYLEIKDIKIDKDIVSTEDLKYDTELTENTDIEIIENKNKKETQVYVKFLWSENDVINNDSIYKFEDANELLETLTDLHKSKNNIGYDKTKFELHFNKDCTDKFYTGRFDIGDGFANNLKEHLYLSISGQSPQVTTTPSQRNFLFESLNINPQDYKKSVKSIGYTL